MSYLPFALLAYFLNSISVMIDKYLLVKRAPNPLYYIFYISLFSELVLAGIPFVKVPASSAFLFASASTLLWTTGAYFMFRALKVGNPTRVVPTIGALIPVILAWIGFVSGSLTIDQIWAIGVLIMGLFFLIVPYLKGKITRDEIFSLLVSAFLFADSYIILRWAYQLENFASVFVYSRIVLIPLIAIVFTIPILRKKVLDIHQQEGKRSLFSKGGWLFLIGQATGGSSEMLLTFSISLAYPALVNSLQGVQYVFLFIFGLFLSKKFPSLFAEKLSRLLWTSKIIGILLIITGLFLSSMAEAPIQLQPKVGVTFSPRYAQELGLDPIATYTKLFTTLGVKYVRLPVYWSEFETDQDNYDYSDLDQYLNIAKENNAQVMVAIGYKSPRWPECYPPAWARNLSRDELQQRILLMLKRIITKYKDNSTVTSWQVENEPFLLFGDCPAQNPLTYDFVKTEVDMVRDMDNRPVLVTDSGEISDWRKAMSLTDYFGTTMYRQVWNPYFGYLDYPLPSFFYVAKNWIVQKLVGAHNVRTIVSELQAEPWVPAKQSLVQWNIEDQIKAFPPKRVMSHYLYAKSTKFPEIYLWGSEWWFWMNKNGYPDYLEVAKQIFRESS